MVEHLDPAKIELSRAYREKYPTNDDHAAIVALRSGKSFLAESVPKELPVERIKVPDQLQMILDMGISSLLMIPMVHRERALGVITFVSSTPEKTYTLADLVVAEDLGRRAAVAIENARLFTGVGGSGSVVARRER